LLEHDRAVGAGLAGEGARLLDQLGNAGRVVERAVIDGVAGFVGLGTTIFGLGSAFLPTADVTSVLLFEIKMIIGVAGPTLIGWLLFRRAQVGR